jgi:glycosyltransferase involved in cell wall biosynthesis
MSKIQKNNNRLSGLSILNFLVIYFSEKVDFFFSFKLRLSLLKVTKGKINILFIVDNLGVGGQVRLNLSIAQRIKSEKYSFHLMTTWQAPNVWQEKFKPYFQNMILHMDKNEKPLDANKLNYKRFRQILRKLKIQTIILNLPAHAYAHIPQLKTEFKNLKIIDITHNESNPRIQQIAQAVPYIDKRICVSNLAKNYQVKMYEELNIPTFLTERLTVIHNGVDTDKLKPTPETKGKFHKRYQIPENTKIITFIGRFSDEKNPLLFVDIAEKIISNSPYNLKFVMAGHGPDFQKVKNKIKNRGLENHIIMIGAIDFIEELLNDTFILLVVSKREGVPFSILEAMSMGVPVLSTNVGAINEIIYNNTNGFLINLGNEIEVVDSFSKKILELMKEPKEYERVAGRARETILARFSLEAMAEKYQRVFDALSKIDAGEKPLNPPQY